MNIMKTFIAAFAVVLAACGGAGTSKPTSQSGTVSLTLSDASTEDWATIGVRVLGISLQPQGGGAPVTIFTAPSPAPVINLAQLDEIGELLGALRVPAGTYTAATLTIAANPGDIALTAAANPSSEFAGSAGATIDSTSVKIQGATGVAGARTTTVTVPLSSPLVVAAGKSNALDIEFDLSHPAFLVDVSSTLGTVWAMNFHDGPVRHRAVDVSRLVLRQLYGTVTAVATDGTSLTITKDYPVHPVTSPETAIASAQALQILPDATNGTLFYDVDAIAAGTKTGPSTITSFSSLASTLPTKFVRLAARYQQNGTLVATRIWASSRFQNVWLSPEGHVLHVNRSTNVLTLENADGIPGHPNGIPLTVDANTKFFFRAPASALSDTTPIGTGPSFLANIVRGFKVHASVVDPLAATLVAQTIDIEIAKFDGRISDATTSGFTYTRNFSNPADDYTQPLTYVSSTTPNGTDASGNAILGFKWWDFAYPTLADSGANAIPDFVTAANSSVTFAGMPFAAEGVSYATWGDPANSGGWSALFTVLTPVPLPLGRAGTAFASNASGGTFGLTNLAGTAAPVPVDVSSVPGSATLVYQVDASGEDDDVKVSRKDLTNASDLAAVMSALQATSTVVKVFGLPEANGTSVRAYVLFYYTGTVSTM